jgi:hypothetical protein
MEAHAGGSEGSGNEAEMDIAGKAPGLASTKTRPYMAMPPLHHGTTTPILYLAARI